MPIKVYKRTDSARSIAYQDELLARVIPDWPDVTTFTDGEVSILTRPTTRKQTVTVYAASFALFADDEAEMLGLLKACNKTDIQLQGAEENYAWHSGGSIQSAMRVWKEARQAGAAMRGARISAETKKAKTAAAFAKIHHDLVATKTPSKPLLASVGIRSIASIKNHYGKCREDLQRDYQAELKRAERRKAKAV